MLITFIIWVVVRRAWRHLKAAKLRCWTTPSSFFCDSCEESYGHLKFRWFFFYDLHWKPTKNLKKTIKIVVFSGFWLVLSADRKKITKTLNDHNFLHMNRRKTSLASFKSAAPPLSNDAKLVFLWFLWRKLWPFKVDATRTPIVSIDHVWSCFSPGTWGKNLGKIRFWGRKFQNSQWP